MKRNSKSKYQGLINFTRVLSFITPQVLYLLTILLIFPAPNSGFLVMGYIGSLIVSLGMVNVVGLLDDMYFGNVVTAITMTIGGAGIGISSFILYTPGIYSRINEAYVTFYFIVWAFLILSFIYYPFFRHAVSLDLQKQGFSKTRIKKSMEDKRNYWWYDSLKGDMSFQWIYYVNKLFTIVFPCTVIVHLLIGWWNAVFFLITITTCFLLLLNSLMAILFITTWDRTKKQSKRLSPFGLVAWVIFPVMCCCALIKYYFTMK